MGKAMSNSIKSKAKVIISEFKDKLSVDFRQNKEFIKKMNLPLSKLTINLMAGYITRTLKAEKKQEEELNLKSKDKSKVPLKESKDKKIHA